MSSNIVYSNHITINMINILMVSFISVYNLKTVIDFLQNILLAWFANDVTSHLEFISLMI